MITLIYVTERDDDTPFEMVVKNGAPLEKVVREAKQKIVWFAQSEHRARTGPKGFLIENIDGDVLYRWYQDDVAA